MTQCNFIFHALRSLKGRLNGAFFCFFYFIHLKSERLVYPFFFFFVKHKSWTVARCIYIIGIHLERHHRVLMGMRVEVDYRDRTAPLREWNAMFMLGFHQKKKKHTHTRVIKHTSIRDHMRLSWVPPVPSRMPGGRLRGWLKGLKREIKVIMYISNPQRFQRAKRPKKKKREKTRLPATDLDTGTGASVACQGQRSPWQQIIQNNYLPYAPCHN